MLYLDEDDVPIPGNLLIGDGLAMLIAPGNVTTYDMELTIKGARLRRVVVLPKVANDNDLFYRMSRLVLAFT